MSVYPLAATKSGGCCPYHVSGTDASTRVLGEWVGGGGRGRGGEGEGEREWEGCRGERGWGGWGLCIGDSTILVKIVTGGCGKVAPPVRRRGGNQCLETEIFTCSCT